MPERNRPMKPGSRRWRQAANEGGQRGIRSFFSAQKPPPPSNQAPLSSNQAPVSSKAPVSSSRPLPPKEAAPKRKFKQQAEGKNKVQKESQGGQVLPKGQVRGRLGGLGASKLSLRQSEDFTGCLTMKR